MKIAVTAMEKDPNSKIDARFGRANTIIIYDTDSDIFESVNNTKNLELPEGAGIQTAKNIVDCNADVVITQHVGPKAFRVLRSQDIPVFKSDDITVKEAVNLYITGKLSYIKSADVESHW